MIVSAERLCVRGPSVELARGVRGWSDAQETFLRVSQDSRKSPGLRSKTLLDG